MGNLAPVILSGLLFVVMIIGTGSMIGQVDPEARKPFTASNRRLFVLVIFLIWGLGLWTGITFK